MTTPDDAEQPNEPDWARLFSALDTIEALVVADTPALDPYQLLTREEVAAHLRCTKQYVSALTVAGKLHTVRIGKRILVPRADLEAFIRGEPARRTDGHYPPTASLFDGDE